MFVVKRNDLVDCLGVGNGLQLEFFDRFVYEVNGQVMTYGSIA